MKKKYNIKCKEKRKIDFISQELEYQTERQLRKLSEKEEEVAQQVPLDEDQLEQITNALQEQYPEMNKDRGRWKERTPM